jgi:hypothetical protein
VDKPDPKPAPDDQWAWDCFREFEAAERHFNTLQSQYRALASTWLLAAFGGIGFLVAQPRLTIPIDTLVAVSGIGIAATVGITLLWNLDLLVYHALMFEYFQAGLELEDEHAWLPKVRTNIRGKMKGTLTRRVALFYIAGNSAMLIVAGAALTSWSSQFGAISSRLVVTLTLAVVSLLGIWMLRAAANVTKIPKDRPRQYILRRRQINT